MKIYGLFTFAITVTIILFETSSSAGEVMDDTQSSRKLCATNADCADSHQCIGQQCLNVCSDSIGENVHPGKKCGQNAICYTSAPHIAACKCLLTHIGNPYHGCLQHSNFFDKPGFF